ncbi:hypothetical protein Tco_0251650 [Tanacetum coccineum]
MAGVDINTLTVEQYLSLSRENQAPGVVKPEIGGNVNFEIKSQFMRELRVSKDAFMLLVFPFTLTGSAKRWVDRLASGTINTWDILKKAFIQRYCPPSMTANQLEDIYNFKQEGDESLYQVWERYNDLLYKCPTHDINSHQKVNIFYKGLSTMNRQLLDSRGPIPGMRPAEALIAIQTMADHSQKWHDGTTSRNIRSSSSKDGLAALVNKMDLKFAKDLTSTRSVPSTRKLNKWERSDMGNLDEQRLLTRIMVEDKPWPKQVITLAKEAVTKIDNNEDCKAIFTNDGAPLYTPFYYSPEEIEYILANSGFSDDDELNNVTSIPDEDLKQTSPKQITTHYVEPYIPSIPFPRRLEQHVKEVLIHKTMEILKKIKSHRPFLKEIRQSDEYPKFMKDMKDPGSFILPCSIGRLDFNNALADLGASISIMPFSIYKRLGFEKYGHRATHQTKSVTEEVYAIMQFDVIGKVRTIMTAEVDETMKKIILTEHWRKQFRVDYDESNDFYDPDRCGESRNNEIRERVINNLHDEWFKGTSDDEDDIEGIIDYLEPTSYDGFIDLDEEEYNKRRCRLLGMPYIAPLPLIIEQVEITRYSLGPGEVYTKVEVLNMEELPRTRNNIATIRSYIMDEVYESYVDDVT